MESMDLDMNDLFDRGGDDADNDGEDYGVHAGLPDLDLDEGVMRPQEDQHGEQNEDDEVLNNLKNLSKGAAKKKVQRPQPKLDVERLKSDRGLPALTKLFKDTQFRGQGREVDDLKLVMGKLEHWAHRLYPKMPFDDFIERLEKLGAKKEIQTCVKRIRLDMPILDEDFVSRQDEEETKRSDNENASPDMSDAEDPVDAELAYDAMIQREREAQDLDSRSRDNSLNSGTKPTAEPSTPIRSSSVSANSPSFSSPVPSSSQKASEQVTIEQQERMERNRLQALQKRAQRLGLPIPTSLSQSSASSSHPSDDKSVCSDGNKDHLNADSCLANNLTADDSINRIKSSSEQQLLLSVQTAALGNAEHCSGANNDIDENLGTKLSNPADRSNLESGTSDEFGQEAAQTEDEILEGLNSS